MMLLEQKERADQAVYDWKLAYIAADPEKYTPLLFPEAMDQEDIIDNFEGEIEYDLTPLTSGEMDMAEAAEILKQFEVH